MHIEPVSQLHAGQHMFSSGKIVLHETETALLGLSELKY